MHGRDHRAFLISCLVFRLVKIEHSKTRGPGVLCVYIYKGADRGPQVTTIAEGQDNTGVVNMRNYSPLILLLVSLLHLGKTVH